MVQDYINKTLVKDGINLVPNSLLESIELEDARNSKCVKLESGDTFANFDEVICAIGRELDGK